MRILAPLLSYPPRRRNGAFITTHAYLAELVRRGHQVDVVHRGRHAWELDGVTVHPNHMLEARGRGDHDLLLYHHGYNAGTSAAAKVWGIPRVVLVHGESTRMRDIGNPDLVWFGSDACRRFYRWAGPCMVSPPPIRPADYATTPGDHVTLVGLSTLKGVAIFHHLARSLRGHRFLGVESAFDRQHKLRLPNVSYIGNTANMRDDVYARTRVLIVPSVRESFGRVGLEAMCSGIPVVAAPTPGMVEAYRDGATFVDQSDPKGWTRTVARLMDDDDAWRAASLRANIRALGLAATADVAIADLADAVERVGRREPIWTS